MCRCKGTFSPCSAVMHGKHFYHECACTHTGEWLRSAEESALKLQIIISVRLSYVQCQHVGSSTGTGDAIARAATPGDQSSRADARVLDAPGTMKLFDTYYPHAQIYNTRQHRTVCSWRTAQCQDDSRLSPNRAGAACACCITAIL